MAQNLRLRHHITRVIRRFLEDEHGFLEVRAPPSWAPACLDGAWLLCAGARCPRPLGVLAARRSAPASRLARAVGRRRQARSPAPARRHRPSAAPTAQPPPSLSPAGGDAHPDAVHPRGRPRLPGALPVGAGGGEPQGGVGVGWGWPGAARPASDPVALHPQYPPPPVRHPPPPAVPLLPPAQDPGGRLVRAAAVAAAVQADAHGGGL